MDSPKILIVEPFRLMHTGNFFEFFENKWKNISPDDKIYFGISTRNFPESNCSIYSYVHDERESIKTIHYSSQHESTAVYKKGYIYRLKCLDKIIHEKSLKEIISRFKNKKMPFDYFGDQGLSSKAKRIYNLSEIKSLICYNKRELEKYLEIISKLKIKIPLYLEYENPFFIKEFNNCFSLIEGISIDNIPFENFKINSLEEIKKVSSNFKQIIINRIKILKEEKEIINKRKVNRPFFTLNEKNRLIEEVENNLSTNNDLINIIERESSKGKIIFPKRYLEKAKIIFSKLTRERGIPRYLYITN